ncbi:MAG: LytR C-terminal domain-containing protein [Ignavibacteria bacterium]|nr:LytR C-terminal domain-containing protein [Ignavibacteria bacterium]
MKFDSRQIASWLIVTLVAIIILSGLWYFFCRLFVSPNVDATVNERLRRANSEKVIQLSVLNASGVKGLAKHTMLFLRRRGFDVVETGNTKQIEKSRIIDYVGDTVSAMRVAQAIGLEKKDVIVEIDSSLFLRCAVVIGKNYQNLKVFQ